MSITDTVIRERYNCTGAITDFVFAHAAFDESDLEVWHLSVAGVMTLLTYVTHYTITPTNNSMRNGCTVTTVATYPLGDVLMVIRAVPYTQPSSWDGLSTFSKVQIEADLDRLDMQIQQLSERLERSLTLHPLSTITDLILPDPEEGKFLIWKAGQLTNNQYFVGASYTILAFMEVFLETANKAAARAAIGAIDATWTLAGLGEKNFSSLDNDLAALAPDEADEFPFYDITGSAWKKVTRSNLVIPPYVMNIGTGDWPYTASLTRHWTNFYGTSGASDRVFDLPAATGSGKVAGIFKPDSGAGDVDVTPNGTDNINGLNAVWKINAQFQYVVLQDRAAGEWHVLDCLGTLLEFTSAADVAIGSPQSGTWANPASHSLSITPGYWLGKYKVTANTSDVSSTVLGIYATLSTANNSESDVTWSEGGMTGNSHAAATLITRMTFFVELPLLVAVTTTYYLNIKGASDAAGALTSLTTYGASVGETLISARRIA